MQGVTTAIVAFIFFCIVYPQRVKSRPQFFAAMAVTCIIILLDAFNYALGTSGFRVFSYFATAALQVGDILILFMAVGGLSWDELKDDMAHSYEVIRRGGDVKEVIVPLSGEMARRPGGVAAPKKVKDVDETPGVIRIDSPVPPKADDSSVPLEE